MILENELGENIIFEVELESIFIEYKIQETNVYVLKIGFREPLYRRNIFKWNKLS